MGWRRPRPTGAYLDLKKFHSDASSVASDTGVSGASDVAGTSDSELVSDAGETLSTRDTISDVDTGGESLSELETLSELDSEAGDTDEVIGAATELPLVSGMKGKKRTLSSAVTGRQSSEGSANASPKAAAKKVV